jgi:CheY-like chemotaxis protein
MRPALRRSVARALNILAVDDEISVAKSLKFVLSGPGRTLSTAGNGEEALARIAEPPPVDVLITDNNMPRLSGLELVRRLRAVGFPGRIVVLSAHLTAENRRAYDELKVDRMLAKPFDVQELRDAIKALEPAA